MSTSNQPFVHVATEQAPPVPVFEHAAAVVLAGSGEQSPVLQHDAFGMQLFVVEHTLWPAPQRQFPGGPPTHVWPDTVHCMVVQQFAVEMQEPEPAQAYVPGGQAQEPPMPEHFAPLGGWQSVSVQHVPSLMQRLNAAQTCLPAGHWHAPP